MSITITDNNDPTRTIRVESTAYAAAINAADVAVAASNAAHIP